MFNLRRRAKTDCKPTQPSSLKRAVDTRPIAFEFVATFDDSASATHYAGKDSGVYTMCLEDSFAVLRDENRSTVNETAQAAAPAAPTKMPKVIAVMLEPDGQSRFFHPEASRRAGRPIWQPLQPLES